MGGSVPTLSLASCTLRPPSQPEGAGLLALLLSEGSSASSERFAAGGQTEVKRPLWISGWG